MVRYCGHGYVNISFIRPSVIDVDRSLSMLYGRPSIIRSGSYDVDLPQGMSQPISGKQNSPVISNPADDPNLETAYFKATM